MAAQLKAHAGEIRQDGETLRNMSLKCNLSPSGVILTEAHIVNFFTAI